MIFDEAVAGWETDGAMGIFSLGFFGEPPEGMYVSAVSYLARHEDSCDVYEDDSILQASSPHDNWVMFLFLSKATTGDFAVQWSDESGEPLSAQVLVKHVAQGVEVERHTSLSGSLTVTRVPQTIDEWAEGVTLELSGTVEFATSEDKSLGCAVGGTVDQEQPPQCECRTASGERYTCEGALGEVDCCIDVESPRKSMNISLTTVQCAPVCSSEGLLYQRYCADL